MFYLTQSATLTADGWRDDVCRAPAPPDVVAALDSLVERARASAVLAGLDTSGVVAVEIGPVAPSRDPRRCWATGIRVAFGPFNASWEAPAARLRDGDKGWDAMLRAATCSDVRWGPRWGRSTTLRELLTTT